jgi:hypothetical protein
MPEYFGPKLKLSQDGKTYIVFTYSWVENNWILFQNNLTHNNGISTSFIQPVPLDNINDGNHSLYPSFCLGPQFGYIAFLSYMDMGIYLTKFDLSSDTEVSGFPALAAISEQSYYGGDPTPNIALNFLNGEWRIHLVYHNSFEVGKKSEVVREVNYLELADDGSIVQNSVVIDNGDYPDVAVSSDNTPHVAYRSLYDIYYATKSITTPPEEGTMHVEDIVMSSSLKGARWNAVAAVLIHDDQNPSQLVSGATVTGNWSGIVSGTGSATTDANGIATLKSPKTKNSGDITFTVTGVVKDGWTYDQSANKVNSGSISNPLSKSVAAGPELYTPSEFVLLNNYPNPFNPETRIAFQIPELTRVKLAIYNLHGQKVINLVDENRGPGKFVETWCGKDGFGRIVPSGVYVYHLEAGQFVASKKMLLLK